MKRKTHQPSIKTVFKKLDNAEPWTAHEKKTYSVKERNLIRGLQLRDKTDKETSKQTYIDAINKSNKAVKALSSSVRGYIDSKYPKHGQNKNPVPDFKRKDKKTEIRKKNKTEVKKFLDNKDNKYKDEKSYNRVSKGSKKYPNASVQELRHGVNSKWSQNYRVNHGLTRNYK